MPEPVSAPDVRSVHATFARLFNAGDVEGLVGLYEPDAVLHVSPGQTVRGHDAIRAAMHGFLALGGKMTITTLAVFDGPGGIALTHGEWAVSGGTTELAGKTAEVLRRQPDGRWLYVIDNPWL